MRQVKKDFNYFLEFESEDEKIRKVPLGNENGTDNDKCLFYQRKYLAEKDEKSLAKLWLLVRGICLRMIRKEMRLKKFFIDEDERIYRADVATEYILRRYEKYKREKGEIYFFKNFIAASHSGVIHALYHSEENDFLLESCVSLDEKFATEKKGGNA